VTRLAVVLRKVTLKAQSPRNAFYVLTLERITDGFLIRKASGANGRVYDREAWFRESLPDAEKLFGRIFREKTNPNRRNPRKYVVESSEQIGSVLELAQHVSTLAERGKA